MNTTSWYIWEYTNTGRVFIVDPSIGRASNILNAVVEIMSPNDTKLPEESPFDYKVRLCKQKRPIADMIMLALGNKSEVRVSSSSIID